LDVSDWIPVLASDRRTARGLVEVVRMKEIIVGFAEEMADISDI
jgi:hypothetical protein